MRVLLFLGALLIATPAFAIQDYLLDYCLTTADPKACLSTVLAGQAQHQRELQQDILRAQIEQSRLQAQGLMLFGSGPAFINGMNQGFQHMQQPYVNTPAFSYPAPTR